MSELKTNLEAILQEKQDKIIPENIKKDISIFDIIGTYEGLDTSDANAIADDIIAGKTAYVNGEKITGNIVKNDPISPSGEISMSEFTLGEDDMIGFTGELGGVIRLYADTDTDIHISVKQSDLANYIGLTPDKIKIGETILGVTGTYIGEASL